MDTSKHKCFGLGVGWGGVVEENVKRKNRTEKKATC